MACLSAGPASNVCLVGYDLFSQAQCTVLLLSVLHLLLDSTIQAWSHFLILHPFKTLLCPPQHLIEVSLQDA